jgi:hypothetical protein
MLSVRLPNDPKGWEVEQKRLNACTKNIQIYHYICHYAFHMVRVCLRLGGWVKASLAGFWLGSGFI